MKVDSLDGGAGSDKLSETRNVNMTLANGSLTGLGTDTLVSLETAVLTGGVSANKLIVTTFLGAVTLNGGRGNDSLVGGSGNDFLDGGDGNDTLIGNEGDDILIGGNGTDLVIASGATEFVLTDTSLVGVGSDMLSEIELVQLTTADDDSSIDARQFTGRTTLIGGAGNDTILGGMGIDSIRGGDGNDVLLGNDGNDSILGGAGNDIILGGAGNDSLGGGSKMSASDNTPDGDDTILGGVGKDRLFGGGGDDVLSGEEDNDTLAGGAGTDMLFGGDGTDSPSRVAAPDQLSPDGVFADADFVIQLNNLLIAFP